MMMIVDSYVRAQIAKAISHLNFAMSHAGRSAWLDMEACIGSHQDRVEETLKHRNLEYSKQETATAEAVEHLVAAWSVTTKTTDEPIPALVWAVFRVYRDGDDNTEFAFVGAARSDDGAQKLANEDAAEQNDGSEAGARTITTGSRFEYDEDTETAFAYLIEAVKVEP